MFLSSPGQNGILNLCIFCFFSFILLALLPTLTAVVRITHSHTSESMSFTYQRSSKSVCIDTRPCRIVPQFQSDSEEEEDEEVEWGQRPALTYERPTDQESAGDPAWKQISMHTAPCSPLPSFSVEFKY